MIVKCFSDAFFMTEGMLLKLRNKIWLKKLRLAGRNKFIKVEYFILLAILKIKGVKMEFENGVNSFILTQILLFCI